MKGPAPSFLGSIALLRLLEFVGVTLLALPFGELVEKSTFTDLEFEESGGLYLLEFLRFARETHLSTTSFVLGLVGGGFLLLLRAPLEFFVTFRRDLPRASSDRLIFGGKRLLVRLVLTLLASLVVGVSGYLAFSRSGLESDPFPKLVGLGLVACATRALGLLLEFASAERDLVRGRTLEKKWLERDVSSFVRRIARGLGLSAIEILGPLAVLALAVVSAEKRMPSAILAEGIFLVLIGLRLAYLDSLTTSSDR